MITLLGPTASGKTSLAVHLAYELGGEILSADSRQLYKGMDIGTGKDLDEYILHGRRIPYHLIDLVPAGERYSLFAWQRAFHRAYEDLVGRGIRYPILCGGTGLYAEAVLRGYHLPDVPPNPSLREELRGEPLDELRVRLSSYGPLHNTTDLDSAQRAIRAIEIAEYIREQKASSIDHTEYPPIDSLILCLDLPREERRSRITLRLRERLEHQDMIGEVKELLASGIPAEDLIYYGLEYKFVTRYLLGELSYDEMFVSLETAIHQFAKRQMTWFRGMERRGFTLHYIDALLPMQDKVEIALQLLHSWETDNQR
ncbi:tRNA (adenosine(37)-N6)-dimethylallyltransferase MiaA [uncultured Porphyromonas sp.]|uniref:tRNA (adenosine(37)-N6)-dimethylallyltransferase n=1 Tax=uncultured Porphyromonas sp. TaxID=159274 RepID=UPI00260E8739|nr:tRNA (adenosine(37)-N6)-dimethylallyltransferase MiaA [uncultured Porphyromonas sp.]